MSYKICCGDCFEIMENMINKNIKVDMILTDPPYGIDLTPQRTTSKFKNTKVKNDDSLEWLPKFVDYTYELTKNIAVVFLWMAKCR